MTKIVDISSKSKNKTWMEAMTDFIDNTDESVKAMTVQNVLIISLNREDYAWGVSSATNIRGLLGTMECVKEQIIRLVNDVEIE